MKKAEETPAMIINAPKTMPKVIRSLLDTIMINFKATALDLVCLPPMT